MQLSEMSVLVVGAGTGGAATALLLARAGARVTVVERVRELRAAGAGLALAANGRAVLDALGLGPALAEANVLHGVRVVTARGRTILKPPTGAELAVVTRARLQSVLLDAMAAEPNIDVRLGVAFDTSTPDGAVRLSTATGHEEAHHDLIVGADGTGSRVRTCGAFGATVTRSGIRYLRALVPNTVAEGTEAWTAAGVFGALPLDSGTYLFASCAIPPLARAIEQRDLSGLRAVWQRAYAPGGALLDGVAHFDDLLVHEVIRVYCERWFDGRLVLVGDAAHAMAPNLGQGANSALVDAVVLLDCLRAALDVPSALAAYTRRRRDAVQRVAQTAARMGRVSDMVHPLVRTVRDRLVPLMARVAPRRQLKTLLQESPAELFRIGRMVDPTEALGAHPMAAP